MKKAKSSGGTVVYCGPPIRGLIRQYTAFTSGLPAQVKDAAGKNAAFAALIVPLEQLPEAMRQIQQKSGRFYTLYQRVQGNI